MVSIPRACGIALAVSVMSMDGQVLISSAHAAPALLTDAESPVAAAPPLPALIIAKSAASFSIAGFANGGVTEEPEPCTYQWQHEFPVGTWFDIDEGMNIGMGVAAGIASPVLTLSNLGPLAVGRYRVVLGNCRESVVSREVILTRCPADFNFSGSFNLHDLLEFLAAYFSADLRADINTSGSLSVQDLFDFLAAYLAGC